MKNDYNVFKNNRYSLVGENGKKRRTTISTLIRKIPINKLDMLKIIILVFFTAFISTQGVFAQQAVGDVAFGKSLGGNVSNVYKYIKVGVQCALGIWFIIGIIQGIIGKHNKESHWWGVVGIFAVIAFLEVAMQIYNSIAGTSAYIQ